MQTRILKYYVLFVFFSWLQAPCLLATDHTPDAESPLTAGQPQVVDYPSSFFSRYKPNTALDIVNQVPGFFLDNGNKARGFGATAGNILINSRRPGTKEDTPSLILGRIPAGQVDRIQLIRGQISGVDMTGHTEIVNVVLREDAPATVRWETGVRRNFAVERLLFKGNISVSDKWEGIDYNAGVNGERASTGASTNEDIFDGSGILVEKRVEDSIERGYKAGVNLNASALWGNSLLQFYSRLYNSKEDEPLISSRLPQITGREPRKDDFFDNQKTLVYELGLNAERKVLSDLTGKLIFLFIHEDLDTFSTEHRFDQNGDQIFFRSADSESIAEESIVRLEMDWTGVQGHELQMNLEGAYNSLDNTLEQLQDTGAGLSNVSIPGGNTLVEEVRGDFLIRDIWNLGQIEIDYGMGAELSTLSQSGDNNLERDFFFLKPHTVITYSPTKASQFRARLAREVSQLNFSDFVSASIFQDDDVALGNPNLRPDTTWIAELGHERRFGPESVIKVTLFHHWINDVLDLLPITATSEAPGNIGDGRRWGIEIENTLPMSWSGLTGAKLDVKFRLQDSTVVDPVTGEHRRLSGEKGFGGNPYIKYKNENRYALLIDFRQDFETAKVAWGFNLGERDKRVLYKVNELDVYDEGTALNAFIETTRWFGLKLRLIGENLTDLDQLRERTIFTGQRDLSPVEVTERGIELEGLRLTLSMSGSF